MEFFTIFAGIFFLCTMIALAIILIYSMILRRRKSSLKPVAYISYHKTHFNKEFQFTCEYCGATVSTKQLNCPQCGSAYGRNKEYRQKKHATNLNYLNYLQSQEEKLREETAYIEKTMKVLRRNRVMRPTYYNFNLDEYPVYRPAADYEFTCDFCDTKLRGRSTDTHGCPNCGAEYRNNTDLLVREAEDRVEKCHFEEYIKLKDIEWQQNIRNENKDRYIAQKHAKQISFMTKNGKYVALLIVAFILVFSLVIALICTYCTNPPTAR